MAIILFLGNPGKQYIKTRHNIGWNICDVIVSDLSESPAWKNKFHAEYCETFELSSGKSVICRPQTFMNKSGITTREILNFYKAGGESLIVVHDDLETPFGTVTFQYGGGLGGHNGLKSLKTELGYSDFFRLKIGIGRPQRQSVSSFVLGRFSSDEEISLSFILKLSTEMLRESVKSFPMAKKKVSKSINL